MRSDTREPLDLGQDRMIPVNQLADMIAQIAYLVLDQKSIPTEITLTT